MLKTLLLICLLTPCFAYSQSLDSLNQRILKMEAQQNDIRINLGKHSKEFVLGTTLVVTGAALVGTYLRFEGTKEDSKSNESLLYVGSGVFLIGTVLHIDSH